MKKTDFHCKYYFCKKTVGMLIVSLLFSFMLLSCSYEKSKIKFYYEDEIKMPFPVKNCYVRKDTLFLTDFDNNLIISKFQDKSLTVISKKKIEDCKRPSIKPIANPGLFKLFMECYKNKGSWETCYANDSIKICYDNNEFAFSKAVGIKNRCVYKNRYVFIYPKLVRVIQPKLSPLTDDFYTIYVYDIFNKQITDSVTIKIPTLYKKRSYYIVYYNVMPLEENDRILISFPLSDTVVEISNLIDKNTVSYYRVKSNYLNIEAIPDYKESQGSITTGLKYAYKYGMYSIIYKDINTGLYFRSTNLPTSKKSFTGWYAPGDRDFSLIVFDKNLNILGEIYEENLPADLSCGIVGFLPGNKIIFDNKDYSIYMTEGRGEMPRWFLYKYEIE